MDWKVKLLLVLIVGWLSMTTIMLYQLAWSMKERDTMDVFQAEMLYRIFYVTKHSMSDDKFYELLHDAGKNLYHGRDEKQYQ